MAGAADAAARLRSLPADATATEVLCAALGTDRRHLATLPGGAAGELARLLSQCADAADLMALCAELDGAARRYRRAAASMRREALRDATLACAEDYEAVAARVRAAVGRGPS